MKKEKKKGDVIFELQAFCAGDLTGREQLTVKVDYDQNNTFVYSMEEQKHCVVVKFISILFPMFLLRITHQKSLGFSFIIIFQIFFSFNLVNM